MATNPLISVGGKAFVGGHGQAFTKVVAGAPNGDTFGTVTLWTPASGPRYFTLTQASPIPGTYLSLRLNTHGTLGDAQVATTWRVPDAKLAELKAGTGELFLGDEDEVLGRRRGMQVSTVRFVPRNATGDGSCAYVTPTYSAPSDLIPFVKTSDPILGTPLTEGVAMALTGAQWTGESSVDVANVFEIAEDGAGLNSEAVVVSGDVCPNIDGALDTLRFGQTFTHPTIEDGAVTYWSEWVAITPTVVVTPVTNVTPPVFAASVVAYDGATNVAGLTPGATISQTGGKSAEVYLHAALTATTGLIFTGTVTSGPFSDNVALTGTNIAVVADGASSAYVPTEGGYIAWKAGTYAGAPTGNETRIERATDGAGTGAATYTPTGGRFPSTEGGKFDRIVERVTGYGIADFLDTGTAWTEVANVPLAAIPADEWLFEDPSAVSPTIDQMENILTLGVWEGVWWSTGTDEALASLTFPQGREAATANGSRILVRLRYDGATTAAFDVGDVVTGGTSGKTGALYRHVALTPTTGTLFFVTTSGTFLDNEPITATGAAAVANGASESVTAYKWQAADAISGTPPKNYRQFVDGVDDVRRTRGKVMGRSGLEYTPMSLPKTLPDAPAPTNARTFSRITMRKELSYLTGELEGSARQFLRSKATTPANGGRVICGIDITMPTMTDIFGEHWFSPRLKGCAANSSTMGMGIDRQNADWILYYGSTGANQGANGVQTSYNNASGVYLSQDGGRTMTQVLSLPDSCGANRNSMRCLLGQLAQAPGGTAATNRTWYCIHSRRPWAASGLGTIGVAQMYKSTDGGQTWATDGAAQAAGVFGEVRGTVCRDNGSGGHDVYVYGANGIFRRASGSSSWVAVTGISGLVTHVEVRGTKMWAMRSGNGLYVSTNGTSFSSILSGNYHLVGVGAAQVSGVNSGKRRIFVSSRTSGVAARWSDDEGATWTHSGSNNVITSIKSVWQTDDFSHNIWGESVFFIPHELDPDQCLVMLNQHMGRLVLTEKNAAGNYTAIWSSRGYDYSRVNSLSFGSAYDEIAWGATDRAVMYSDHGTNYVHDGPIGGTFKNDVYEAIEGTAGKYVDYQAAGPIIFENNGHKRVLMLLGEGALSSPKVPVVFSPDTETPTKSGTGNGTLTSLVMPKGSKGGTYEVVFTGATAGSLYAPATSPGQAGAILGTFTTLGAKSYAEPAGGGNITFTLTAGATAFVNGTKFSWYHNPIGTATILSGATGTTFGSGQGGSRNPADATKGCSGKRRYSMNSSGVVSVAATLAYEFQAYSDANVIWARNGNSIMRSANEGATWATFWSAPGSWTGLQTTWNGFTVSLVSNQRCFIANDNGEAWKIDTGTETKVFDFRSVMSVLEPGTTFVGRGSPTRPPCWGIVEDPSNANILTVTMGGGGTASVFRTIDGGTTWVDITASDGMLQEQMDLFINRYTGEPIICSRHGTLVVAKATQPSPSMKADVDTFIGDAGGYVDV